MSVTPTDDDFPEIPPKTLIKLEEWLAAKFPDRIPTEEKTQWEFGWLAGQQHVLRVVKNVVTRRLETITMNNEPTP